MPYNLRLRVEVDADLAALSARERILVFKQLKKLSQAPELGQLLGKKAGIDLSGYRKMYADRKRIRVVYRIIEERIEVEVVAVGKRNELEVYRMAAKRLG
jgi:mRNA interferase RelE/StbE